MNYNFELHQEIASLVCEALHAREGTGQRNEELRLITLLGLTRHNFNVEVRHFVKEDQWVLRIVPNGKAKDELLANVIGPVCEISEFVPVANSTRVKYQYMSANIEDLVEQAGILHQYIEENSFGEGTGTASKQGVNFVGTQFDRLKERGATISGMFGNLVCQASGMNLLMMQAEYYVSAGEIDGVEFAEDGSVISIYECQSGIHKGNELDDEHTMKALGSYLYDPEIIPTVRKVVVLAGAYSDGDMQLLRERAYELSRRERPIELVALITTREGNRIGVERVIPG